MNMTARLVPGATTVTTNARYYALHGLVALEAQRQNLDLDGAYRLLRRCEVVVAGASIAHPDPIAGTPHGYDALLPQLHSQGYLDVGELSVPQSGYANPRSGFLGPYLGSELTLGILASTTLEPGPRAEDGVLRSGFPGLFELAGQDQVAMVELEGHPQLAIGAARSTPDGAWLAHLLCGVGIEEPTRLDATRRGTIQLLARAAAVSNDQSIVSAFRSLVAYGPGARTDPVASRIPEVEPWRGTLFRHDSVGAWRQLWAWLVRQINGLTAPSEIVEATVSALPTGRLDVFLNALPEIMDSAGEPAPAEEQVRSQAWTVPQESLALLALGAARVDELDGHARAALVGDERRPAVLSPMWVRQWIDDRREYAISDVADELVRVMLDRARRIALHKMEVRSDGHVWLRSRVQESGEMLYKIGEEGSGNVGLRLSQLAGILAALGVLDWEHSGWSVTDTGLELLGVDG